MPKTSKNIQQFIQKSWRTNLRRDRDRILHDLTTFEFKFPALYTLKLWVLHCKEYRGWKFGRWHPGRGTRCRTFSARSQCHQWDSKLCPVNSRFTAKWTDLAWPPCELQLLPLGLRPDRPNSGSTRRSQCCRHGVLKAVRCHLGAAEKVPGTNAMRDGAAHF